MVPLDAGPGHQAWHYNPLDYSLLDQVDEGVQRLAVAAPLTPKSRHIADFEEMVKAQNRQYRETVEEAQSCRERGTRLGRAPPASSPSLPPMPAMFSFGGFSSNPTQTIPNCIPGPIHPSPIVSPTMGLGSLEPPSDTPFLSAKGSLFSHMELSRDMRRIREQKEEKKRGIALKNTANLHVDDELFDIQTTWLQMQVRLDKHLGGGVPPRIQEVVDAGERQLTSSRQGLRILESHGPLLAAQFRGDPLLTSEEQVRLRSLVKDQKDCQSLGRMGGGRGQHKGGLGMRGARWPPRGAGARVQRRSLYLAHPN